MFIKHHSTATECTEEAFFGAEEGGGTLVSPAIILTEDIIQQRFPPDRWNVYVAQASDGDNYYADNAVVAEHLHQLLPRLRRFFYLEVNREYETHLFQTYKDIAENHPEMFAAKARVREDIYPLFRALFSQEMVSAQA